MTRDTTDQAVDQAPACPAGHGPLHKRAGRTGAFWGCPRYPDCRETVPVGLPGIVCPACGGPIVERIAKKSGRPFWPCGNRLCNFVAWEKPHPCKACGAPCFGEERERPNQLSLRAGYAPAVVSPPPDDDEVPF